ncbi:MAG: TetR/AcrR family transcriptional regulator [Planctomycetota bacterium]
MPPVRRMSSARVSDAPRLRRQGAESRTKERILDVAESLFADRGVGATSLRRITRAARVNLAAVNYHFRSKDRLIDAVFSRRLDPLISEQLALLDEAEARAGKGAPRLEDVLRAVVRPAVAGESGLGARQEAFRRLLGRVFAEPGSRLQKLVKEKFVKLAQRVDAIISRILPGLSPGELFWCRHLLVGALHHVLLIADHPESHAPPGLRPRFDPDGMVERIVAFAVAGYRASAARAEEGMVLA